MLAYGDEPRKRQVPAFMELTHQLWGGGTAY